MTAIFVLVTLAALGAFMVVISTAQHTGLALDVQGARAYQAARAGVEWGMYRVQRDGFACGTGGTTSSFTFPAAASTLAGFTVTVVCTGFTDASGGPAVTRIEATACNKPTSGACPGQAGTPNYVERRVRVVI